MSDKRFSKQLIEWYYRNKRELPWRESGNPYRIWVSEIMLQQTRVDQAIPYYHRFIERFPTVQDLADADRQEVLKVWEGLGYYSRARHLHEAARTVADEYDGQLPDTWDEILSLKGIGPYTASAVLSIAFGKPHAVVDGNVLRVLARYYGIEKDIRKTAAKNEIQELADDLIDPERPGDYNQALMELGATVCVPSGPACGDCPLSEDCVAHRSLKTEEIPYKSPAGEKPHHQIGVGIVENEREEVLIALRPDDVMLGGLWEFPGGKQEEDEPVETTVVRELREELGVDVAITAPFMKLDHAYSHFKITLHAFRCELISGEPRPKSSREIRWVPIDRLGEYPFPKANRRLTEKLMELETGQQELNL